MAARARSRSACGSGERARRSERTYAQQVDMMSRIAAHNRLRDGSLETRPARGELTQQKLAHGGGNLDHSVNSALLLALTR